jgi:hypothetical protein
VFGASPDAIPETENDFPVFKENLKTVIMFMKLATQWKTTGFGGILGLDYVAVKALLEIHNVKNKSRLMDDLQVMEFAALKVFNQKEKDEAT